jgi:5'-methylthioinosine phosphorylase
MSIKPAIIAGSGLLSMPNLVIDEALLVNTQWGQPSGPVYKGRLQGVDVLFMARHGDAHTIPPHKVNYRANIGALKKEGATHVLAYNAVGGIGADCETGKFVVADQIIDYTWGREHTYYDGTEEDLEHIEFTSPYNEALRQVLISAAASAGVTVVNQGVYGATQGPRLESGAEIKRMERDGCDIVGMTGMPEVALAREKTLPYASLSLVVNAAAGKTSGPIAMADIEQILAERIPVVCDILSRACVLVSKQMHVN